LDYNSSNHQSSQITIQPAHKEYLSDSPEFRKIPIIRSMAGSEMDQHKERKKFKNNDNINKYST
jgi:hypothetical protein